MSCSAVFDNLTSSCTVVSDRDPALVWHRVEHRAICGQLYLDLFDEYVDNVTGHTRAFRDACKRHRDGNLPSGGHDKFRTKRLLRGQLAIFLEQVLKKPFAVTGEQSHSSVLEQRSHLHLAQ